MRLLPLQTSMKGRLVLKSSLKPAVVLQLDVTSATVEFLGVSSLLDTPDQPHSVRPGEVTELESSKPPLALTPTQRLHAGSFMAEQLLWE